MTGSFDNFESNRSYEDRRAGDPFDDSHLTRRGWIRTSYNYELPDGTLLYQQNRYDHQRLAGDKKFLPSRPDGFHQYLFGVGERRVIYNWPAIMRAGPGATVFVTEGEKNAKSLINAGLLATTIISHKWTDECVAALTGYDIIILEDHDNDGKKLASIARDRLSKVARSIRVVPCTHLWSKLDVARAQGMSRQTTVMSTIGFITVAT